MTINTTSISTGPYTGTDSTDTYVYDFKVQLASEISVIETDLAGFETTLVEGTDFSVTGVGDNGGGNVVRTAGNLPTGFIWLILRSTGLTQTADFPGQGAFTPLSHEKAFDKLTQIVQENEDTGARSIRAPISDVAPDMLLPVESVRAGNFLAFDASGNPTISAGSGGGDTSLRTDLASSVANFGAALVGDPKPYSTAFLQTMSDIINGVDISIMRFITTASGEHGKIRGRTSTTDHTTDFNDAITELNAVGGGQLIVPYGDYNAEDIVPKQAVTIMGGHRGALSGGKISGSRIVSLGNGSHTINQSAGSINSFALQGLVFRGPGAATAGRALSFLDMTRLSLDSITFDNFADEALFIAAGNAGTFSRIHAQNCLLDKARAAKIGVFHLLGNDHILHMIELTASSTSRSDANLYICAIYLAGSNHFLSQVIGEISDVGIHAVCSQTTFMGVRVDLNYGHGFELAGSNNLVVGSKIINNSQHALDTYSGMYATVGGNQIVANLNNGVGATRHKYGFLDTVASDTLKNIYDDNRVLNYGTAAYLTNDLTGSVVNFGGPGPYRNFVDGDTTPSVDQYNAWRLVNTAPTIITTFDDGISGQPLKILGDAQTTFANGATLKTNTGASKATVVNKVYRFTFWNNIWVEDE